MESILITFALSLFAGAAAYLVFRNGLPAVEAWYLKRVALAQADLKKQFSDLFLLNLSPRVFAHLYLLRVPLVAVVVFVVTGSIPFLVLSGLGAYFAPRLILEYLKRRRMERFDDQLVDALALIASSARAGLSLVQALEAAAVKMAPPASQEFGLILKEYQHGTPIERALTNARDRLCRPNFNIVTTALIVNREKGGNLIEVVDKIASSLREITRLEKKIRTETASVRFSAKLMSLMPLTIGIIFYFIEPSSMELLFTDFVGTIILFFVVLLNVVAMVIIQRIVTVDI
jgi:tight adherence protein B